MMNEEWEQFEARLTRQPMKPAPAAWRAEILAAARSERSPREISRESLAARLRRLFWPSPLAWGGLGAAWIFMLVLHLTMQDRPAAVVAKTPPPSPALQAQLRLQRQMFGELLGATERSLADRQPMLPLKPRSGRTIVFSA